IDATIQQVEQIADDRAIGLLIEDQVAARTPDERARGVIRVVNIDAAVERIIHIAGGVGVVIRDAHEARIIVVNIRLLGVGGKVEQAVAIQIGRHYGGAAQEIVLGKACVTEWINRAHATVQRVVGVAIGVADVVVGFDESVLGIVRIGRDELLSAGSK